MHGAARVHCRPVESSRGTRMRRCKNCSVTLGPPLASAGMTVFNGFVLPAVLLAVSFTYHGDLARLVVRMVAGVAAVFGVLALAQRVRVCDGIVASRGLGRTRVVPVEEVLGVVARVEAARYGFWPLSSPWNGPRDLIFVYLRSSDGSMTRLRGLTGNAQGAKPFGAEHSSVRKCRQLAESLGVTAEIAPELVDVRARST